jgi:hypothetical protein
VIKLETAKATTFLQAVHNIIFTLFMEYASEQGYRREINA